jgi:hypothetical protein
VRAIALRLPARPRRWVPVTALVLVVLLAGIVGGTSIGFATTSDETSAVRPPIGDSGEHAVLLVPGYAGECCSEGADLRARYPELLVEQYSYAGLDAEGRPLPHTGAATDADLGSLADIMAAQVRALNDRTGRAVSVVAESEGTLVVATCLDRYPNVPIARVMHLSPIVDAGRATFPDAGHQGRGLIAGYELRFLGAIIDRLAPLSLGAEGPFLDSVRAEAGSLLTVEALEDSDVEQIVVVPLADAVVGPPQADYGVDAVVVPAFHGGLRDQPDVQDMIAQWVDGERIGGSAMWMLLGRVIAGSASAWHVPELGQYE